MYENHEILKFNSKIMKNQLFLIIPCRNHDNNEIHIMIRQNHDNHENEIIPCRSHEHHEILRIP